MHCPAGYYCAPDESGNIDLMICPAGYYCPENSTSGTTYPCPYGYVCPEGTSDQSLYQAGWDGSNTQGNVTFSSTGVDSDAEWWIYIVIGVAVLVVLIIIIVLILKRRAEQPQIVPSGSKSPNGLTDIAEESPMSTVSPVAVPPIILEKRSASARPTPRNQAESRHSVQRASVQTEDDVVQEPRDINCVFAVEQDTLPPLVIVGEVPGSCRSADNELTQFTTCDELVELDTVEANGPTDDTEESFENENNLDRL